MIPSYDDALTVFEGSVPMRGHDDGLPEQFRFAMAHDQSCSANTRARVFPYG